MFFLYALASATSYMFRHLTSFMLKIETGAIAQEKSWQWLLGFNFFPLLP